MSQHEGEKESEKKAKGAKGDSVSLVFSHSLAVLSYGSGRGSLLLEEAARSNQQRGTERSCIPTAGG